MKSVPVRRSVAQNDRRLSLSKGNTEDGVEDVLIVKLPPEGYDRVICKTEESKELACIKGRFPKAKLKITKEEGRHSLICPAAVGT